MKAMKLMQSEYRGWLFHSRMILLPCVFIMIYTMITTNFMKCAGQMQAPINIVEPFVGVCNSPTFLGFIPIVFLVLIADFPRIDQNMIFKICRAGRKKWIVSQLLFLLCADLTFVVLLFVGVTLPVLKQGFLYNGWSDVVTEMLKTFPELKNSSLAQFIPANLYYQMLPYRAVLYSAGFLILYLYLLGLLMLLCKIHGRGALGVVVSGGLVIAGSGFVHLQKIAIKWLFPAAHGIVQTHYSTYYRRMDCTLQTSFLYFALLIGISIVAALRYAKKIDYIDIVQME